MTVAVIPLPNLIRIRVTGADRARFLHNFCTNDINGLQPNHVCEAFFTNVKARVLAHGYLLAADDCHEIWMLPGDESQLLNHLTRYVITEDVEFESLTDACSAVALLGQPAASDAATPVIAEGQWADKETSVGSTRCVAVKWDQTALRICSGSPEAMASLQDQPGEYVTRGETSDFERLRILERFPRIGSDLSDDNLAPESLRTKIAFSYTKGCYLGQEPIARLDAMGQVNRVLATLEIHGEVPAADDVCDLTSFDDSMTPHVGLAVIRAADLTAASITDRTPSGVLRSATVTKPASLTGD